MLKPNLLKQPTQKGYSSKFYINFFPAAQTGFVIGSIKDIKGVMNFLQVATLYELHHEMLTRPKVPGDMPNVNGPYECILDVFDNKMLKSHLLKSKRNYYDNPHSEYSVQFFIKKAPDMEIEKRIKKYCRKEGIKLRYLDCSFFVGAVQIWLADESNKPDIKAKLKTETWKIIKEVEAMKTRSGATKWTGSSSLPYEENRIVYYDDIMVHEFRPIVKLSKIVDPSEDYHEFVEKVLKSEQ